MKSDLIYSLKCMASKSFHIKYIVNGTKDRYVLPEDIVEDVASSCRQAQLEEYRDHFTKIQHDALNNMLITIRQLGPKIWNGEDSNETVEEFVHTNPYWNELRECALDCLSTFGETLNDFNVDNLD